MSDLVTTTQQESPVFQALAMIERAARDQSVDIAKMQVLQEMQFKLIDRQKVEEWHEAVESLPPMRVKKNGIINLGAGKDGKDRLVPFATWEDMDDILRPLLREHSLFLTFDSDAREGGGMTIRGTLRHRSGHFLSASIPLPIDTGPGRNNLQAMGSTLSYGKRYTTEMLLNIVREGADDDGKLGGTRFISEEQAATLRKKCEEAGRPEDVIVQRMFGDKIHSFDEIEVGGYEPVLNTLEGIIQQNKKKAAV